LSAATAFALALVPVPGRAELLELSDFRSATTDGIVKLCTAPQSDPMHQAAIGYCVGYLTGAFHYYKAVEGAGNQPKLVCFGSAEPGRRELIEQYVAWAQAHPEHGKDLAIDTMFRFLGGRFPC
jgi:hypothetical protein